MNVQELIDKLLLIPNKTLTVEDGNYNIITTVTVYGGLRGTQDTVVLESLIGG